MWSPAAACKLDTNTAGALFASVAGAAALEDGAAAVFTSLIDLQRAKRKEGMRSALELHKQRRQIFSKQQKKEGKMED